ncbi:hypothetical protein NECID01_1441 [Nematocida sp. AWRm77]|nr:hypothetical protein NECID01_1441 [Nematocida sp. AWRm77]
MKKSTAGHSLTKNDYIQGAWLGGSLGFIFAYVLVVVKTVFGLGLGKRVLHLLCCSMLMLTYSSCVFFKTPVINIQKLLRDGNFRCLLVACSLLSMKSAVVPIFPFFLMSVLSLATYVVKHKQKFEKTNAIKAAVALSSKRDELTLLAFKIEIISVPLLVLHLLAGTADLFVVVSYTSLAWFEYNTNPCMKKAARDIIESIDSVVESPSMSPLVKQKYAIVKRYIGAKLHPPATFSEPVSAQDKAKSK